MDFYIGIRQIAIALCCYDLCSIKSSDDMKFIGILLFSFAYSNFENLRILDDH